MSLFGNLAGGLAGSAISSLTGGKISPQMAQMGINFLSQMGGTQGLVDKFTEGGLGDVVQSWVGTGENKSITGDQVQNVLGDQLKQFAGESGMDVSSLANMAAQFLPQMINGATPQGKVVPGQDNEIMNLLQGALGGNQQGGGLIGNVLGGLFGGHKS